jgi:hypothetical protein
MLRSDVAHVALVPRFFDARFRRIDAKRGAPKGVRRDARLPHHISISDLSLWPSPRSAAHVGLFPTFDTPPPPRLLPLGA